MINWWRPVCGVQSLTDRASTPEALATRNADGLRTCIEGALKLVVSVLVDSDTLRWVIT